MFLLLLIGLDKHYTDSTQHLITAGEDPGDLDELFDLDHDLFDDWQVDHI